MRSRQSTRNSASWPLLRWICTTRSWSKFVPPWKTAHLPFSCSASATGLARYCALDQSACFFLTFGRLPNYLIRYLYFCRTLGVSFAFWWQLLSRTRLLWDCFRWPEPLVVWPLSGTIRIQYRNINCWLVVAIQRIVQAGISRLMISYGMDISVNCSSQGK